MTPDRFSPHMEAVAKSFWGDPNPRLSTKTELRFGSHGARSVDLEKGVWYDNEVGGGGGVLDLIARETHCRNGEAVAYLRDTIGIDLPDDRQPRAQQPARKVVATYDYPDEDGEVLFQVVRFEPKDFRQRRPDPTSSDGWCWSVKGARQILYRLPEVLEAVALEHTVFIVEGEKDADALWKICIPATCNAGGAGKWPEGLAESLRGADVVILPDNDEAGRKHAAFVSAALSGAARSCKVLHLPSLAPKGDVSDWIAAGGNAPELHRLAITSARPWTPAPPESRFGAIPWADLDRTPFHQPYIVKGLMNRGDVGMFYGESGSGKSFLAVDMGLSVARGVPFLGMKTAPGGVIYQAGEGGKGLLKRLRAYRQEHRVAEDLPFVLLPAKINLFAADGDTDAFIEECVGWKAALPVPLELVFIDTFSAASTGANENASEDMGRMLDAGYRVNQATGAAVVWVHHKNAGGLRERGHTSFRANIETVVEVTKDSETKQRTLHLVKMKDGEDGLKIGFELQSVEIGTDDDGDPITSCVVRPAQVGSQQTGKKRRLPTGQINFLKTLDEAVQRRGGIVPVGGDADGGTYGVEWTDFRDMYRVLCGMGRDAGAVRAAMHRDGNELWREGLIGRNEPWLWVTARGGEFL